ncbi:hypothetical protein [Thermaerobacillus caldiproteolyticus]|uniref:hypothetical protein n=1 Tax=Thermaerobacillus caldiproteolyticus TaxID=247480 RepID=UPI001E29E72E|nr:hypothetical protein [Anoxybacillus caldiproteolyticus]
MKCRRKDHKLALLLSNQVENIIKTFYLVTRAFLNGDAAKASQCGKRRDEKEAKVEQAEGQEAFYQSVYPYMKKQAAEEAY